MPYLELCLSSTVPEFRFAMPSKSAVEKFSQHLAPLNLKAENCNIDSQTLASIRDLLLPQLVSGEVRVMANVVGL